VQQFGAGSGTEGIQALTYPAFPAHQSHERFIVFLEPERCGTSRERSSIGLPPSSAADVGVASARPLLASRVEREVLHCHGAIRIRGDVCEEVFVEVVIHQ
jgi:hypothetical protein